MVNFHPSFPENSCELFRNTLNIGKKITSTLDDIPRYLGHCGGGGGGEGVPKKGSVVMLY